MAEQAAETTLILEPYLAQQARWPTQGRHVLAQYDDASIVVYQAYRPSIADAAVRDQALGGGGFSLGRMSWIKPNFLWMMFRAGWATKPDQERILAIRIRRASFDAILGAAIPSKFVPGERWPDSAAWEREGKRSDVRLQWDPDHGPTGQPLARRAIQLGLRGETLRRFATTDVVRIEDVTPLVEAQRDNASKDRWADLVIPRERVYPVADPAVAMRVGVD